jgi:hypothetical protein
MRLFAHTTNYHGSLQSNPDIAPLSVHRNSWRYSESVGKLKYTSIGNFCSHNFHKRKVRVALYRGLTGRAFWVARNTMKWTVGDISNTFSVTLLIMWIIIIINTIVTIIVHIIVHMYLQLGTAVLLEKLIVSHLFKIILIQDIPVGM